MEKTISVHLVEEKEMRELNKKHRKKDRVTDVLSFPLLSKKEMRDDIYSEVGDVFLCLPRIKKQAAEYGVSFEEEIARMLAHGVLHLLGFDHKNKKSAKKMFHLQEKIVKKV